MEYVTLALTTILLLLASINDILYYKVPNKITFPAMIIGLLLCGFPFTVKSYYRLTWLFIFFFIGMFRIMGMGDLKLCMAVLCLRGPMETAIMMFVGSVLLFIYCLLSDKEETLDFLKSLLNNFLYHTGVLKLSNNVYPFALFLALGYSMNIFLLQFVG